MFIGSSAAYGLPSRLWKRVIESEENLGDVHPLTLISHSLNKVILLSGQPMNTCSYITRFNILMSFVIANDKKKVESMIKENGEAFNEI